MRREKPFDIQRPNYSSSFLKLNAVVATALALITLAASETAIASEMTRLACMKDAKDSSDESDCNEREIESLHKAQRNMLRRIELELSSCIPVSEAYNYKAALMQLRGATNSWTLFAKRDCEVISLTYGVGTGAGSTYAHCHINHLRLRNKQLANLLRNLQTTRQSLIGNNATSETKNSFISCIEVNNSISKPRKEISR